MHLIAKRQDLVPILSTFANIVKHDVKAAMSDHAYVSQASSSLKVVYDLQIYFEAPKGQSLLDMYMQLKQEVALQTKVRKCSARWQDCSSPTARHVVWSMMT